MAGEEGEARKWRPYASRVKVTRTMVVDVSRPAFADASGCVADGDVSTPARRRMQFVDVLCSGTCQTPRAAGAHDTPVSSPHPYPAPPTLHPWKPNRCAAAAMARTATIMIIMDMKGEEIMSPPPGET